MGWLSANGSIGGGSSIMGTLTRNSSNNTCGHHGPPSPCPSEHMPYSSASSSLSEGSSGHRSHEDDISIVTGICFDFFFCLIFSILFKYVFIYLFISVCVVNLKIKLSNVYTLNKTHGFTDTRIYT